MCEAPALRTASLLLMSLLVVVSVAMHVRADDCSSPLILAEFEDCRVPSIYVSYWGPFDDGRYGKAVVTCTSSGDPSRGEILHLDYEVVHRDAFAGLVIKWNVEGFDPDEWEALSFYIRGGESFSRRATVELKINDRKWDWQVTDLTGITSEWQLVTLPLTRFRDPPWGPAGWYKENEITITLASSQVSDKKGSLYADGFRLIPKPSPCPSPNGCLIECSSTEPFVGTPADFSAVCEAETLKGTTTHVWDFGDGARAEGSLATHAYDAAGDFTVTLLLQDENSEVAQAQQTITVRAMPRNLRGIVVGIDDYLNATDATCSVMRVCDLSYCEADARDVAALLNGPTAAVPARDVDLYLSEQATSGTIYSAFNDAILRALPEELVVFYFSGHGGRGVDHSGGEPDGVDEYLIPYDYELSNLYGSAIRDDRFLDDFLIPLEGRYVVVFLDSCYSGGGARDTKGVTETGYKGPPASDLTVYEEELPPGTLLVAASSEDEVSREEPSLGHGVFTYFLLEAVTETSRGFFASDVDKDGIATLGELFDYVKATVIAYTGGSQTPVLVGDMSLLALPFAEIGGP